MATNSKEEGKEISNVSKLDVKRLGITIGILFGLIMFIATNWLVIKGGTVVGPHLQLINKFFIGYKVTFGGSIIGLVYGFIVGYISGAFTGWLYNTLLSSSKK